MIPSSKPLRLAVVGVGRVGRACAELIALSKDLTVAALVRRPASGMEGLPEQLRQIPVVTHVGQARDVDGALICVPTNAVVDTASQILRHRIPIIDCATLHGDALRAHTDTIHRLALHHGVPAIVGVGWDPGVLSVFRSWFALLAPGGTTETRYRTGVSLRHTTMARSVTGVKDALCAEVRAVDGRLQRYVYVELQEGTDPEKVAQAIRADPLFLGEDTQVFSVESLAGLEEEGRGVVLDRRGPPARFGHQHLLLEARVDETILTAQVMLAAARALPQLEPGVSSLIDIPPNLLWGEQAEQSKRRWL